MRNFLQKNNIAILFIFILMIWFWGIIYIPDTFSRYIQWPVLLFFTYKAYRQDLLFRPYIIFLFLSVSINACIAFFYHGQSPIETFKVAILFFYILFFYVLVYFRPSLKSLYSIISVLLVLYIIVYYVQFIVFPIKIVHTITEYMLESSSTRFYLPGHEIFSLCYFYLLNTLFNKITTKKIILIVLLLGIFVLGGSRSVLFGIVLSSIFLLYRNVKKEDLLKYSFYIVLFAIVLIVFIQIPFIEEAIGKILERNNTDNLGSDDFSRLYTWNFLVQNASNVFEYIFGTGLPSINSSYGKYILLEVTDFSDISRVAVNYVDLGYIGLAFIGGIPLVATLIGIKLKAIKMANRYKQLYFIQAWMIYTIVSTVFYPTGYNYATILIESFVLYILYIVNKYESRILFKQ